MSIVTIDDMAVAALVVAIIAVLVAAASAVYFRVQARAAMGSLSIEQGRREVEVAPRYDPVLEYGPAGLVLRLTSKSQQPTQAIRVEISSGYGVSFDASRRDRGDPRTWIERSQRVAFWYEPLYQDSSASWPVLLGRQVSGQISLEVMDMVDRNRTVTVIADVPPPPTVSQAERAQSDLS